MNEIGKLLNIKDRLFLDYAVENPKRGQFTSNEIKFLTSYDFGLLDRLVKELNTVLNDLKQDDNPNYEQDLNKLQKIQNKIMEANKSFEDNAFKVGLVNHNFDKAITHGSWSKLFDYLFGELSTKFKNLILLNKLFINSLKDKNKKRSGIKLLVPSSVMPKSNNPDDYSALLDYLGSNYKEEIKQKLPNINQISKLNDSIKENLNELEKIKEFDINEIKDKLNEPKKSYKYWYDLIISKGVTDYYSATNELNENKLKIDKIRNMIQQEIKNKKQGVSDKTEQRVENFVKELKIELDGLNDNTNRFIKYLKSKAEETNINDLEPDWDEYFEQPLIPSYIPAVKSRKQSTYTPSTFSYTPSTLSYTPAVRPREQQLWQERIKKDQEIEKQAKDQELERLLNKARKRRKKANKEYYGYVIVPPIYPTKMLVNLVKLLTRICEGNASKKVVNETKLLLNTLYNNKIITETVYNHLANI